MGSAHEQNGNSIVIPREDALKIRGLVCGVDGVLTNGLVGYTERRNEIHFFDTRDGLAMRLASWYGLQIAWVTGRISAHISQRAQDLDIRVYPGYSNKELGLRAIAHDFDLPYSEIAYVGDDLNDLLALRVVGFPIAVANASPEVKAEAHYTTRAAGGDGAVREIIEAILRSQGRWDDAVNNYLSVLREPERVAKMPRTEE